MLYEEFKKQLFKAVLWRKDEVNACFLGIGGKRMSKSNYEKYAEVKQQELCIKKEIYNRQSVV